MSTDTDELIDVYEESLREIDETIESLQHQRSRIAARLTLLRAREDTTLSVDEIPFETEEQVLLTLDIFLSATGDTEASLALSDLFAHASEEYSIGQQFMRELLEEAYEYGALREQDMPTETVVTGYHVSPQLETYRKSSK